MTRQALLVHGRIAVINAETRKLVAKIIKIPQKSNRVEISEWDWFENRFLTLHFIRNVLESYSPPVAPIFGMAMANCQVDNK